MKLITDYKSDEKLRKSFSKLSTETFGINFEEWYEKGLWKDKYETYSIVENDEIVSNVSANKLKFVIEGNEYKALQIGTVMTKETYRGKGLAKELMNFVLDEFQKKYDFIYLFPNTSVFEFYKKFGFEEIQHKKLYTKTKFLKNNIYTFEKLNVDNKEHLSFLKEIGINRVPHSEKFDVLDGYEVMFWYCLNVFRDNIYFDKVKNIIVIYTKENEVLSIHDIISTRKIDYYKVVGSLVDDDVEKINFDFNLEMENVLMEEEIVSSEDDALYVMGKKELLKKVVHPITSHA